MTESPFRFLTNARVRFLTLFLLLQGALFYGLSRAEAVRNVPSLAGIPTQLGSWRSVQEGVVEKEVMDILKADDVLTRMYSSPEFPQAANLFVAHFKTQRTGKAPHSPRNCLPGSGWVQSSSGTLPVMVPGRDQPIPVNRYVVTRGEFRSVVLYWYESRHHSIGSEYWAKLYLVLDSLRYNRSDTALVKVVIPVTGDQDEAADRAGADLIRAVYGRLSAYFPG